MENTKEFNANVHRTESDTSQFCMHKNDEISKGNRYYWKIPKGLPSEGGQVRLKFKLHNKIWEYRAYYRRELSITINTSDYDDHPFFETQIGIVNDAHEEFALKKAIVTRTGDYYVHGLIRSAELDSIRLNNEVLYIMLEIKRKGEENIPDHNQKFITDFKDFLVSGKSSDMTIEVKREKFKCHRYILESRSPVFTAMMRHDLVEKMSGLVTIKDVEPSIFQEFLLYLYSRNENYLNTENAIDLYELSDMYAVEDLRNACFRNIKKNLTIENFFELFQISQYRNDLKLMNVVKQFFFENSKEIVVSEIWIALLCDNPVECNISITDLVYRFVPNKHLSFHWFPL